MTDDDVEVKLAELAVAQGQTVEAIKQYINMEQAHDMLAERVQEEKTLNWLLAEAVRLDEPKVSADVTEAVEAPKESANATVSMSNTKAELVEAAKALGLDTKGKTKAQLLEAIEAA